MKARAISVIRLHVCTLGFVVGALAAVATSGGGALAFADPAPVDFQATGCWVEPGGTAPTECSWLTVPENWQRPQGKHLKLSVVIHRARDPDPSLAPVIFLSGGPGTPALGRAGTNIIPARKAADRLFPGRSFILFDQRGSGLGAPRLACPEGDDPRVWWDLSTDPEQFGNLKARLQGAAAACHQRLLAEGHDLSAFNTRQSAADVEALRRALGVERVVLFGISYGTRLALAVLRHYPTHVAAAILDSVIPPGALWPGSDGEAYGAALDRLFAACAAQADCAAAYPNLKAEFLALLVELERTPVILEVENLESPGPLHARIDHRVFLDILRHEMYHAARISGLPALIAGLAKGEYRRLKPHAENTFYGPFPREFDLGMRLSVLCRDQAGVPPRLSDIDGSGPYPYLADYVAWVRDLDPCHVWPVGAPAPAETAAVESTVPSLLFAGAFDAATPVELAEQAAQTLSASHLVIFPANAHGQLSSKCAQEVIREFLVNPQVRPGPACLKSLRQPAFLAFGGG